MYIWWKKMNNTQTETKNEAGNYKENLINILTIQYLLISTEKNRKDIEKSIMLLQR